MDYRTRSGKSLSLGMTMAPQDNPRTPKSQSLGMPRKASPPSSTSIGILLGAIFLFTNMICVLLGASCIICVFVCYWTTIILAVLSFERAIYELKFVRILLVLHLYL